LFTFLKHNSKPSQKINKKINKKRNNSKRFDYLDFLAAHFMPIKGNKEKVSLKRIGGEEATLPDILEEVGLAPVHPPVSLLGNWKYSPGSLSR
jgi:hypothetical protein